MAGTTPIKTQIKTLKRRLETPLGILSTFAAIITVCSFSIGLIEWIQKKMLRDETVRWFTHGSGAQALMIVIYAILFLGCLRHGYQILLKPRFKYRFDNCLWLGLGLQCLWSLPLGWVQMLSNTPRLSMEGNPFWTRILIPLSHWPFNVGGASVLLLHRWTATLWSRWWSVDAAEITARMAYLTVLTGIQALVLAWLFTLRYRQTRRFKDPVILVGCGLFLLNSLAILLVELA